MNSLTCTLVPEGSSDRALVPVIEFLLDSYCPVPFQPPQCPDSLPRPSEGLAARIQSALRNFPCDLLIVHRDADSTDPAPREAEIHAALAQVPQAPTYVCVVPVRMTEAWLLVDENAIRRAAGNPNGKHELAMPAPRRIESIPDPKATLRELIDAASNLSRRRRVDFNDARQRVSALIDYEKLRALPSFLRFEAAIKDCFPAQPG